MIKNELDGVNRLLKAISENSIASLSSETLNNNLDAQDALNTLQQKTSEIQEQGVYVNVEKMTLSPETNKKMELPENTLNVMSAGKDSYRELVQRGSKLYDKDNSTYEFDNSIYVELTMELGFDELPQSVKNYIIMIAVVAFKIEKQGDKARLPYTENQLNMARAALDKTKTKNTKPNMLTDSDTHLGKYHNRLL